MRNRTLNLVELTELLERFRLERAAGRPFEEAAQAQVQQLLARIEALTEAIRDCESGDTTRLSSRILLDDLAAVAAHWRGRANDIEASLATALDSLRGALGESVSGKVPPP